MPLPLHRFGVGQSVEFITGHGASHLPPGRFTVQRLLPNDQLDREYLLRGTDAGETRVARETELREAQAHPGLRLSPRKV
ncbi:hypothetical protein [Sabulicella glaciei]|uniref:Uncharacterized protein n=1 Tax=Sabulicella glaciei TaxID=2984948 RepID=A0ABT3P0S8_9PROT|nr:hypothetical protein [Roseococcus sp. MDT2-1-1]MCW8088019.1 hypothetical protein [Roseococcus sp. MDT2-1-1]